MKKLITPFFLIIINALFFCYAEENNTKGENIKMDASDFWELIENSKSKDRQTFIENLRKNLIELENDEIFKFEEILRKMIVKADHYNVMAAMKIIEGWVSDDSYLYFRCWLISQGEEIFEKTIKNPDYLANFVEKNQDTDLEELLYVSTEVYKVKTGKEEDESFPRDICISKGLNYDTPTEPTKGDDWKEK